MRWSPPLQNAQPPSFGDGPLPVRMHAADVGAHARVVERDVQLVDRARPERVAHLRPVERDPHGAVLDGTVVRDVVEVEAGHLVPRGGVEDLGDHRVIFPLLRSAHGIRSDQRAEHLLRGHRRRWPGGRARPRVPDGPRDVRAPGRRAARPVPRDHVGRARLRPHRVRRSAVHLLGLGHRLPRADGSTSASSAPSSVA